MKTTAPQRPWSSLPPTRSSEPVRVDGAYVLDELRVQALLRSEAGAVLTNLLPSWMLDTSDWPSIIES